MGQEDGIDHFQRVTYTCIQKACLACSTSDCLETGYEARLTSGCDVYVGYGRDNYGYGRDNYH